jgi:hypothetical protein
MSRRNWFESADEQRMTITFDFEGEDAEGNFTETMTVPAKFEVCETCNGKGSRVNPAIDGHGLTAEDFEDDPDFREDYMRGAYDVRCDECDGRRVVFSVDEVRCTAEQLQAAEDCQEAFCRNRAEEAYERRMGY